MIYFENIRWKNFLSTGNQWTDIPLNAHSNTIIVGENGAGKSTILNLIPRFYDVYSGDIILDGNSIYNLKIKSLRDNISLACICISVACP